VLSVVGCKPERYTVLRFLKEKNEEEDCGRLAGEGKRGRDFEFWIKDFELEREELSLRIAGD